MTRHISPGVWLRVQDGLMTVVKVLVSTAIILSPIIAVGLGIVVDWRTGLLAGFGLAAFNLIVSLWLVGLTFISEEFRVNGIPYLEAD
jgi:hypothetical protein